MNMAITSAAFKNKESIPPRFTCAGDDVSPPLHWSGVPSSAKSLALIVDDPDAPDPAAPKTTWVHWVLYNLPPDSDGLGEDIEPNTLPKGSIQGVNDWKRAAYGGPCPPKGRHRYFFKLYALDTVLKQSDHTTKAELEKAMQGHVIESAELVGTFEK